ncbi:GNAT family N-acetyltransferase [Actinoalloteichus hymeniacidonis]|uniref:Acetyltransferase, ribosomal protein N-acetylase n=1 Tax=Actinoalloteichus hymeniacidonis TaxID=340345 RepID=A0AAC9MXE2_9PSEU|nr:GNAT family protein [Actinoalloteichus hymeniacidonis]AOS62190.1 acetyltransferase, ribosomal protein N-acetylase [Actinoalloteichus hymeniacidonis]MBB5909785.1 RimJ/RimL family protein N-acetyltransferase [Actinoalloteichus hymeniacidonis]
MSNGATVRLRPIEPAEAEAHWRWNNDPEVMRWFSTGFPVSRTRFIEGYADRPPNSFERTVLGIETVHDGRLIGLISLGDTAHEIGSADFDIYIGEKECWGKGYGTEATRLACRFGFDTMGLRRIQLWVADANAAAIAVYRKVGFVEEGRARRTLRVHGVWHDMVLMGLLDDEFAALDAVPSAD